MKIQPPADKLIVELIDEDVKTAGGIILATHDHGNNAHPHSIHKARVIEVGRKAKYVKSGDYILLEYCFARPFKFRDMDFMIINEQAIVGVMDEE